MPRQAYALRPDVGALVCALLSGGVAGVEAAGTVRAGLAACPLGHLHLLAHVTEAATCNPT